MKVLEDRILKDGVVKEGSVLKVDSFLNHQMDMSLMEEMGYEWKRLYEGVEITKVLTIEASGIAMACFAGKALNVPVLFAKKNQTKNIAADVYSTQVTSYTHGRVYDVIVSKQFLHPEDKVLIIDDFLANGAALKGLIELVRQAGAEVVGCGIAIEKAYQPGGDIIRGMGVRVESLARIASMDENGITFC